MDSFVALFRLFLVRFLFFLLLVYKKCEYFYLGFVFGFKIAIKKKTCHFLFAWITYLYSIAGGVIGAICSCFFEPTIGTNTANFTWITYSIIGTCSAIALLQIAFAAYCTFNLCFKKSEATFLRTSIPPLPLPDNANTANNEAEEASDEVEEEPNPNVTTIQVKSKRKESIETLDENFSDYDDEEVNTKKSKKKYDDDYDDDDYDDYDDDDDYKKKKRNQPNRKRKPSY